MCTLFVHAIYIGIFTMNLATEVKFLDIPSEHRKLIQQATWHKSEHADIRGNGMQQHSESTGPE